MVYFAKASRTVVIRASRETIGLVAAASAMTFALAYAVHSKQQPQGFGAPAPVAQQQQDWTGHLADLTPTSTEAAPAEPMSSAALVVPKSQLALPSMSVRPLARPRVCGDGPCPAKPGAAAARRMADADAPGKGSHAGESKNTLLSRLNPLNHLPDVSVIARPFAYAGNTLSGWIKRF